MPTPDQFDDFSHLPTIDEGHEEVRHRKEALWSKNRKPQEQGLEPSVVEETPPPPPVPAPVAEPRRESKPPVAAHSDEWRALLELEPENPQFTSSAFEEPPPVPEEPPPPIRVNKSVIRPQSRVEAPPPLPSSPPPLPQSERKSKAPVVAEKPIAPAPVKPPQDRTNDDKAARKEKPRTEEKSKSETPTEPVSAKAGVVPGKEKSGNLAPAPLEGGEKVTETPAHKTAWQERWEKVGGLALALSIGAHLLLVGVAAYIVVSRSSEAAVDFLPGGGSTQGKAASEALEHQIQQKKNPWLKKAVPMTRIAAQNKMSEVTLPDTQPDLLDMPKAAMMAPTSLGSGMGLGGKGGGMGAGIGMGGRSGVVFGPMSLFGHTIKARRLAVILDVSTSMTEHLPRVVQEVDRAARGSVVVCYFGCGLDPPPGGRKLEGDEIFRTSDVAFEKYWRLGGASLNETKGYKINPKDPIPMEDIFRLLSKRPQTYFIHSIGVGYTWLALLSNEVRSADALYWFSDFEDHVDFKQLGIVQENLKSRKQKLYIHPYEHGSSYDLVKTQLVDPTGGEIIEEPPR